jgi:hypothetical protein
MLVMRSYLVALGLVAAVTLSTGGCRSCSDGYDYSPPVQGCDCGCGQRAGSNCGCGCDTAVSQGATSACGCSGCGCGGHSGGYYEGRPGPMQEYVEPSAEEVGT